MTIAGASIVSSFQSIERAINQINTAWNRPEQIYNNQLTGQICYMDYAQGDRLEFYMRLDGQADEDKGDTETRNFGTPQSVKVASVGFKRVDLFSELLPMYPNRDPPKTQYASKLITKSSLTKSRARTKLLSEIKIHRSLQHKHIVGFEHFFEDHDNVYILLELCVN
jgi:serine/threonine protein kinase